MYVNHLHESQSLFCLQVTIGDERSFTFDYAFEIGTYQQKVYDECVKNLIEGTFEGFNATVLAYGQVCYSFYDDIHPHLSRLMEIILSFKLTLM